VIWERKPGVSIPTTAVSRVAGQTFVYVAQQKDSKLIASQKPVKLGKIQGNNYQVIEGLKQGEKIVVSGILNLSNGAPIIPQS
jgi:multidrug efflux pump subunit AcrA (membrane-fusion protein)